LDCYIKIHSRAENSVVGVCDRDLIGKILREEKYCFRISESFFQGQIIPIQKAVEILRKCSNFNAVGENIISALLKEGIIHPEGILKIQNVPIALRFIL
jgi:uncharacterized protein